MKIKLLVATVFIFALGINTTEAQSRQKARVQKHRVQKGIKSGELTKAETRRIGKMQRNYNHQLRKAKANGVITHRERKQLRKSKAYKSRAVYHKKHNRRHRY